ncbi:hypothetical protein MPSEU_000139000 [Mayamaea pseudoterrestris]|nr:hypothetical protein MPSEU_000139000 [Mayamaea pseudoterrestris]
MKLSFALFSVLGAFANANNAPVTDLDIQVSCANIHFDHISPKALAFGAKALEVTFNNVHKKADGLSLAKVTATPNGVSFAPKQKEVTPKTGLRAGCKFCGSDDELSAMESLYFVAKGTDNNLKCKFCGSDDDTTLLDDDKLELWQEELTAILALSPYASLSKAEDCRINIAPRAIEVGCKFCGSDDELDTQQQAVTLDVQCDKMDFSSAPVRVLSLASKLLADSFGAIHSTEGKQLSEIFLAAPRLSFSDNAETKSVKYGCKFCGSDDAWIVQEEQTVGCKFCGSDDAVTTDYAIEFSAKLGCKFCGSDDAATFDVSEVAANHAWEQLFMTKMTKAGMNPGTCKLALVDGAMA